jgi:predicted ATPase with chaperone activity
LIQTVAFRGINAIPVNGQLHIANGLMGARLAGLLPALSTAEALQVTMLHSVAGRLVDGG